MNEDDNEEDFNKQFFAFEPNKKNLSPEALFPHHLVNASVKATLNMVFKLLAYL